MHTLFIQQSNTHTLKKLCWSNRVARPHTSSLSLKGMLVTVNVSCLPSRASFALTAAMRQLCSHRCLQQFTRLVTHALDLSQYTSSCRA
jgi:hypothetical protein